MSDSLQIVWRYMPALMQALPTTLKLFVIPVLAALILGFFLVWGKLGKCKICRILASVFISFMRGTPMMIQILLIFIWVPIQAYDLGFNTGGWDPIIYALVAYSLNLSAFFAEIFRSAYIAIDYRQIEAAKSLGMSPVQTFFRVIAPQGLASAFPNLTNMSIEMMKNTSIAAVIGVYDILGKAQQLAKNNYGVGQIELYLTVGVIFWLMGIFILFFSRIIYKRLNVGNTMVKV